MLNLSFNGIYLSNIHSIQHLSQFWVVFLPPRVGELVLQSRENHPPPHTPLLRPCSLRNYEITLLNSIRSEFGERKSN